MSVTERECPLTDVFCGICGAGSVLRYLHMSTKLHSSPENERSEQMSFSLISEVWSPGPGFRQPWQGHALGAAESRGAAANPLPTAWSAMVLVELPKIWRPSADTVRRPGPGQTC